MNAYQLKIAIKNSKPPIWRRCIVPGGITFSQLSVVLNKVMGWNGSHLSEFEFYHQKVRFRELDDFCGDLNWWNEFDELDSTTTYINEYMEKAEWFTYTYDFGDDWQHRATIEKVLTDYEENYPRIIKYKGSCPMEDSGGIYGYYEILEILNDENHPEHEEYLLWAEDQGFWNDFDMDEMNLELKNECFLIYGKGENSCARDIYGELMDGKPGLKASNTAKNKKANQISTSSGISESMNKFDKLLEFYMKRQKKVIGKVVENELTLANVLQSFRKDDIKMMAEDYGIKGFSSLKKEELIKRTADKMLEPEVMKETFRVLRDEEIEVFEKARQHGSGYKTEMEHDPFQERLHASGYIGVRETGEIDVPGDVSKVYEGFNTEAFHTTRRKVSWLIDCFDMAAIWYGVVPVKIMLQVFNQHENFKIREEEVLCIYQWIPRDKREFVLQEDLFIHEALLYIEDNHKDLMEAQGNLEFYIPTYGEIKEVAKCGITQPSDHMLELAKFMMEKMKMDGEEAVLITFELQQLISGGCMMQELMDVIEESGVSVKNKRQMMQLMPLIQKVWNHTRMLLNRGFMPVELLPNTQNKIVPFPEKQRSSNKIYPNAPCPCGSGKKHKHCCGKK